MQFRYPLVKGEMVDLFVSENKGVGVNECINCVYF